VNIAHYWMSEGSTS